MHWNLQCRTSTVSLLLELLGSALQSGLLCTLLRNKMFSVPLMLKKISIQSSGMGPGDLLPRRSAERISMWAQCPRITCSVTNNCSSKND